MGITRVEAEVANPFDAQRHATLTFLIDSGAVYSVICNVRLHSQAVCGEAYEGRLYRVRQTMVETYPSCLFMESL